MNTDDTRPLLAVLRDCAARWHRLADDAMATPLRPVGYANADDQGGRR